MALKKVRLLVRYGIHPGEIGPQAQPRPWGARLLLVLTAAALLYSLWLKR